MNYKLTEEEKKLLEKMKKDREKETGKPLNRESSMDKYKTYFPIGLPGEKNFPKEEPDISFPDNQYGKT